MKPMPKVKFYLSSMNYSFPAIHNFLNSKSGEWDWSKFVYLEYPKLKEKLKNVKSKRERKKIEYSFFKDLLLKNEKHLFTKAKIFQKEWDKINDPVMITLSKVVEKEWPKKDIQVLALLSLNPICPRDIKKRSFEIFYKQTVEEMKATVIHELFHFIYFEKWKEVFPKTKESEINSPHLVWKLSEIVTGVVLNDKTIQKVFTHKFKTYNEFENQRINKRLLLSYMEEFYDRRKSFKDFLINSHNFIKKNKEELK